MHTHLIIGRDVVTLALSQVVRKDEYCPHEVMYAITLLYMNMTYSGRRAYEAVGDRLVDVRRMLN